MKIEVSLPEVAMQLSPLVVTAPIERSGTTLLQRLICSSDNGICYGENLFAEVLDMLAYTTAKLQFHAANRESEELSMQSVLEGAAERWIPDLSPAHADYMYALINIFYVLPRFTAQYSDSIGRPLWGMKRPSLGSPSILQLLSLLPKAKAIYIYRDLYDCVRSAKARKFIEDREGVARMASEWTRNLTEVMDTPGHGGFFLVKYEDLIAEPAREIARLEEWTGLCGVKREVMEAKVNTWTGDQVEGRSPDQYVPPQELTDEERETIKEIAGALIARLYP